MCSSCSSELSSERKKMKWRRRGEMVRVSHRSVLFIGAVKTLGVKEVKNVDKVGEWIRLVN